MEKPKELVLDTDWLTALLAAAGMVFLAVVIGFDVWRVVHGRWSALALVRETMFWRVWDSAFFCFVIWIALNISLKAPDRLLRFASGLLGLATTAQLLRGWLGFWKSGQVPLAIMADLAGIATFLLFAIYLMRWFRSKVVHV